MKIELSHDVIAEKIWERLPEHDKYSKSVKASIERRYQDFKNQNGSYLGHKELSSWEAYISNLSLEADVLNFWNDSRKNYRYKNIFKYFSIYFTIFALSIIGTTSIYYFLKAKNAIKEIREHNLAIADSLISKFQYDSAWSLLLTTPIEFDYKALVITKMLEPIFIEAETKNFEKAFEMLTKLAEVSDNDQVIRSWDKLLNNDSILTLNNFRLCLKNIDSLRYDILRDKYFPKMIPIEGGTFLMGNPDNSRNGRDSVIYPAHRVIIDDFKISETEITVCQFELFRKCLNMFNVHDYGSCVDGDCPVELTWQDAAEYSQWLNTMDLETTASKKVFRLPSESEWEFAARESKEVNFTLFSGHDILDSVAWYRGNSSNKVNPVKRLGANSLGLYDMTGNLREWCYDYSSSSWSTTSYYIDCMKMGILKNPVCLNYQDQNLRVVRGGSYQSNKIDKELYTTYHTSASPTTNHGFRVVFGYNIFKVK